MSRQVDRTFEAQVLVSDKSGALCASACAMHRQNPAACMFFLGFLFLFSLSDSREYYSRTTHVFIRNIHNFIIRHHCIVTDSDNRDP